MRRDRLPEGPDDRLVVAGLGLAALGPLVVASLLVTVRDHMARSNAALVFVIVVVLAAALGGRWAGVTAAVISAMSYDFFLTRPYGSLKIDELEDIVATVLLLAVGLIVGEVVVWAHRGHRQKKRGGTSISKGLIDPADAPRLTDAHFEHADVYRGDQLIRRGRPKQAVKRTKK